MDGGIEAIPHGRVAVNESDAIAGAERDRDNLGASWMAGAIQDGRQVAFVSPIHIHRGDGLEKGARVNEEIDNHLTLFTTKSYCLHSKRPTDKS